ncbi:hypothetical protein WSM22_24520 [Cytophagales bacterium WSM2-2]|nr:hypothetical protein WSM22_24520 [Cytophagales bacterium WSM2-2]
MKHLALITLCLVVISINSNAQYYQADKNHHPKQVLVALSPIAIENRTYFYDGKRVNFENLVFPLISIHDQQVDRNLKTIRKLKFIHNSIRWIPTLYALQFLTGRANPQKNLDTFLTVFWGVVAVDLGLEIAINRVKRKAINKYNEIVLSPTTSYAPDSGLNFGLKMKF